MNQPQTADCLLVMQSVEAAIQRGFSGPVVDIGGALALTQARGVDAETASVLIGFAAEGINEGYVMGREGATDGR